MPVAPGKGKRRTLSDEVRHRQPHYPANRSETISYEYGPALPESTGTHQHWELVHGGLYKEELEHFRLQPALKDFFYCSHIHPVTAEGPVSKQSPVLQPPH